jgi:hypothetical protein
VRLSLRSYLAILVPPSAAVVPLVRVAVVLLTLSVTVFPVPSSKCQLPVKPEVVSLRLWDLSVLIWVAVRATAIMSSRNEPD